MSDAILALRAAIQARLAADAPLIALIGPDRIFDEAPRAARGLYVVHGDVEARDWSAGGERGCEQELTLIVWAAQSGSARQALEAARLIVMALDDADLPLDGHSLVNLRWLSSRLAREPRGGLPNVTIRFRAATEPL
ncbi:DUF3168 domain-containing protein [Bosea sp. SSUT16]|uniref:DUF3168 domain-containing protein n=1 Tax=Bosea spartocytisi TaxID=2773451 RepID=A0A927E5M0_9HYPH|nr:DUF3168 domain-containing protein [Bosea spartocytisi]MBD3844537.1 DUF3168 domain-containing protein [Bosea spartocytisi]MCT4470356.1 DUF3168 domain-containing protein [Bosea spartocytisi]